MTVTEETTVGSIKLNDAGVVSPNTNKLYNNGGSLFWNGSELSTGSGVTDINSLSDGKSDGSSVFLDPGAGTSDNSNDNANVAVGENAMSSNREEQLNTASGQNALGGNTTGSKNVGIGVSANG